MNGLRLTWLVSRGLRCLGLALIVVVAVAGCSSGGANVQGGGANAPGGGANAPGGGANSQPSSAIGTDTASNKLALQSGTGPGGGGSGYSVPVQASAYGDATTVPFMVNTSNVSVSYSYDCSSTGGSGFTADMISGSPGNPGSDDENIADVGDAGGSASGVAVSLQDAPGDYYLQVQTPCDWTIIVEPA